MSIDIPLVDLGIQRDRVAEDVAKGFERVIADTAFVLGPEVASFEAEYAEYCGVSECVGVANGTDALELALRAAGIGPGHSVVVPANTFIATAEAVLRSGAELLPVDCRTDLLIDVEAVSSVLREDTKAVVAVHLYGQLADVEGLRRVVGSDVLIIEDAAQSQGAKRGGCVSGGLADIAATSFYPGKNLGAYGDAGAVTTDRPEFAEAVRRLRNHGGLSRYDHDVIGTNSRLDSLQAVVLRAKLKRLDEWNGERRAAAARYAHLLAGVPGLALPDIVGDASHVWHLYVVRIQRRDEVLGFLHDRGVGAGIHYPVPIHLVPALAGLGLSVGSFPQAEAAAGEILSLPLYPGITATQQERVAAALTAALRGRW